MNSNIINLVIMLVMMQVSRRIDVENPTTVNVIRALYLVSCSTILLLFFYTRNVINQKKDMSTLKYMSTPPAFSGEEGKFITTTVHQYDLEQVDGAIKGVFQGMLFMAFMHLYMKYTPPLLMQSVMPLKNAFENKVVQLNVFGKEAKGDLSRPFKQASFLSQIMGEEPDKKTIEAAEVAGKGGVKEQ